MSPTEFTTSLTGLIADNKEYFLIGFPLVAGFTLGVTYIKRYFHRVRKIG